MKTRTKSAAWRRLLTWGATAPFLAVSLFLGQAQAQEAEDGYLNLVAYWNFDNGAEIDDDAVITDEVAKIEGLIEGTILSTEGRTGEDGDNAIDLGEEPDGQIIIEAIEDEDFFLKPASDFDKLTVSFWQKLHKVQNSSTFWFGAPSAGANNRNAQAHVPWGNNNIYFDTAGCCNGGTQRINKGWGAAEFLKWQHYTFVKDGPNKRIYINGNLWHQGRNTLPLKSDWSMATIGAEQGGGNKTPGILDDFAVFASVLTDDEIKKLAAGTKPGALEDRTYTFPRVVDFAGTMGGFSLNINDITRGDAVKANPDTVSATLDGEKVELIVSKDGNVTSVEHSTAAPLAPGSSHTVVLTFADTAGNEGTSDFSFDVSNYGLIKAGFAISEADVDKSNPGWLVNTTQISQGQGVGNIHGNSTALAEKQIDGGFIDASTEEPYLNEADPDSFEGWSYYYLTSEVINFNQDAPNNVGNFTSANGYEDLEIPGIPGWGDSTDGIASEFLTYAYLEKGPYTFGVNSDDGFKFSSGADFKDSSAVLGGFNGGRGANDTTFQTYVEADGYYPIRVVWYEGGGGANVEVFHIDSGGNKILLGDPDNENAIKCYAVGGVPLEETTTERPSTGRSYLVSISPADGEKLVKSPTVQAVISDGENVSVDKASVKMTVDGEAVDAKVDSSDGLITVTYTADALAVGPHSASVSFSSGGAESSTEWSFSVPGIYTPKGDVPTEAEGFITVREYHGIGTTSLATLMAQAKFPDTPDVNTVATYFEWPQSGDIEVNPPGNVRDNYGWHLIGYIHPPETGEYIFSVATDDNSQLWLSTDSDPANAAQITQESTWVGVRNFQPASDETTSAPVFLEKGKAYFIECFAKEGGGGDNMAVAWSLPSDEGIEAEAGSLPISGEYLSPFTSAIDPDPTPLLTGNSPTGASPIGEGGDIEVTFLNRGLDLVDVSVTVNGAEVASKVNVDGKVSSITASPGDVKGTVEVAVSYNGETLEWSYLTYEPLDPDGPNPVAFWNFDGTTEDWAFGAMGELRNGAVFTDDSYEGQALDLTDGGNQHMHVANASALNIAASIDEVTITFWQKLNSTPNTSSFWAFSPTASSGGRAMQAHAPWSNGNIYWDTAGCCNGGTQRINADATDNQVWEEWNHYAFVKSGSYKAIYVNGELFHDGDNTAPLPTDITYLNVGGDQNGNNSVRGAIDDFAIFAATLDEDQIFAIYEGDRSLYPKEPTYPTLGSAGPSGIVRSSNVTISATLNERGEAVADAQLLLNGTAVDHKTSKDGNAVTVSYSLEAPVGSHDVQLNWNGRSEKWSFKVPALYSQGAKPGLAAGLTGLEYHGIGTTSIPTLQSQDKYPDSPDAQAVAPYFEWPQTGNIEVTPAGNVRDNYGWVMIGYIHPPETGEYVFHVATDDNSELWLSTDESPANAVRIAQESTWQGIRNFQAEGDESVSAPVALEAGKAYFIELVTKEGGGGDNAAVAWRLADDADVGAGALPISGDHLSQWLVDAAAVSDISSPGDSVTASSGNSPGAEQAPNAIDNNPNTKYLNFDKADTGLTISTAGSIVTGLGLTSANDAPERDPATFVLSGSVDGVNFTEIASGDVPAFGARFERQEVSFANDTAYNTYKLIFPTVVNPDAANSMQIAEVELLGVAAEVVGPPSLSYVINGDGTATVTFEGTLQQAASVNGPWVDVDAASPLTIPLDQDAAFVRAKK
ncbi:MAG: PA14 domain-containing protein [Pirellulales bacterium]|nr:PA14 domain-containing protein [Pirellulales bacterium]